MLPKTIETQSMKIIEAELEARALLAQIDPKHRAIVKRVIHASADFDFAENLVFLRDAYDAGIQALKEQKTIIADTTMILSGISKPALSSLGISADCYVSKPEVIKQARASGQTRSKLGIEEAIKSYPDGIYLIGNAPTALIALVDAIEAGKAEPALVVAVPVGFVNVIESKEAIERTNTPAIVGRGRKGGSTIAVAIINALLYELYQRKG
ncbi:MAG: precorrin-8X methylmutase [Coriobacteriia bacterium]|nr:precorrin-8X methylmutase [Coriobacteriia bacterium]